MDLITELLTDTITRFDSDVDGLPVAKIVHLYPSPNDCIGFTDIRV